MVHKSRKAKETAPESEIEEYTIEKIEPKTEAEPTTSQQNKRRRPDEEEEQDISDVESHQSEVWYPCQIQKTQAKKKGTKKTAKVTHACIDTEVEEHLAEWIKSNPLFYDKCDRYFKDTSKKTRLMEAKAKEFGLTGAVLQLWYRNMRTVFTRQLNSLSKKSGSSAARLTARQQWTLHNFAFLSDHICAKSTSRTTVQVVTPEEDNESDAEAGCSVSESPLSSVQTVESQTTFIQSTAHLADAKNGKAKQTAMDDQVSTFMANTNDYSKRTLEVINQQPNSSNVRQLFCNYLTAEMDLVTEEQFYSFQSESMTMLTRFRQERQKAPLQHELPKQLSRPLSAPPDHVYPQTAPWAEHQ